MFLNRKIVVNLDFQQLLYISIPKAQAKNTLQKKYVLNQKLLFYYRKLGVQKDIGIPMGIDPAPFRANLFLYFFGSKHVQNHFSKKSTTAYKYHAASRFIMI